VSARTIVWIVSYPKSGNTWVRFLICNLVFGLQESAAALNTLAPDIHELGELPGPPATPAFFKTHFPFTAALPWTRYTAGAVYVVCDPADVMLSNFHYSQRRDGAADTEEARRAYIDAYLATRGDPRWRDLGMGTWDEHVRSWLQTPHDFPVLPLRYEDLLSDCGQAARRLCAFLGLNRTPEEIERAVEGASFRRMREIEEADIRGERVGIFYKPYLRHRIEAGVRFMRQGAAGEAAAVLAAGERQRVRVTFEPLMSALGYSDHAHLASS
jgi:hypothetical protein